ncbi:uncharacterized protein FIBRA_08620 [Fibroporia radiculosa]|uniref:Nitrogen regulatory protein areA GATA-like domain-containing protein n=1 Tax=Fibroporia radiculosa TaxID=599839 RepID=J4GHU9_9APHY|nr:uncharacterized protein FIBRA_08620 [Fibroporia radiculosa]CCM06363.1 predicted protein [Fibroporia radiculosa]
MPVPPTLTSYLPALLVSVTHSTAPDDSSFSTLPDGQVDYLSHEWREEDVWRSWRNMTRQKNAIANGMRLENASWRTWWKQRNKLKTISPETLNWLKDSDVTWLYGPLHIGSDWSPVSHKQPSLHLQRQNSAGNVSTTDTCGVVTIPKKPILKRRSISQLLSLPASPFFEQVDSDDESASGVRGGPQRPPLLHTKSDTHISLRGRAHRKDSPPRIIAEDAVPPSPLAATESSDASNSTSSDQDTSGHSSGAGEGSTGEPGAMKKKHISFNTFVEQCIAIEKPSARRLNMSGRRRSPVLGYDDGYDEDSEVSYDDGYDSPSAYFLGARRVLNSDSEEDDDDDVIEMRTASSRSRTSSVSSVHHGLRPSTESDVPLTPHPRFRPPLVRRSSTSNDHVTIAPIAPTLLKSTGVGNNLMTAGVGRVAAATKEVELVYVPPMNSNYSLPGTPNLASPPAEDVYHHRESYFSVGTSSSPQSQSPSLSPRIPTVGVLPPPHLSSSPPQYDGLSSKFFPYQPAASSPLQVDHLGDANDTLEYFEGPILERRGRGSSRDGAGNPTEGPMRYAEGGAASVTTGRSSGSFSPGHSPETPVVVVNEVNGATEERTECSRENSPLLASGVISESPIIETSFIHPPSPAVPVPRIGPTHPHITFSPQVTESVLLSPDDIVCRGRAPAPSSVSGSTTSGSTNYTRSTDSRSESRGRSATRNSFSDRDRSGSRSSRGTNSPMGSLSPTGSVLGIAGSHGRGRDPQSKSGRRVSSDEVERGRDRTGRQLAVSRSPPSPMDSPTRAHQTMGEYQAYPASLLDVPRQSAEPSSPPSSVSGSSTASTATARQQTYDTPVAVPPRISLHLPSAAGPALPIPSPIMEEDEQRSLYPTPASSPVRAVNPITVAPTNPASPLQDKAVVESPPSSVSLASPDLKTPPSSPVPIPRSKDRVPRAAEGPQEQPGTFVGRAVDMVSSARGFFGSIWNTGAA